MRVVVFGQSGQVAQELAREMPQGSSVEFFGRERLDVTKDGAVASLSDEQPADIVINAAAYTNVEGAETEGEAARKLNGYAPGEMAALAKAWGAPFVHISTDYVFPGNKVGAYRPEDEPGPINAYGRSKLEGERAAIRAGGKVLVLRTSWVFSSFGANFVKSMSRLSRERSVLQIVSDQRGGPTSARSIASACLEAAMLMRTSDFEPQIHHFSGVPDVSWAEFAETIFKFNGSQVKVESIPSIAYGGKVSRPLNSVLDCSKFEAVFGIPQCDWQADLRDVLQEIESE